MEEVEVESRRMQRQRVLRSAVPVALVLMALAGIVLHTHEFASADDGCLCACADCPEPSPAGLVEDTPDFGVSEATSVPKPPRALPVDAPVVRRGPPTGAA